MEISILAKQIKRLRKSKNYTQEFVSDYLHITRSAYSNYERGIRPPSYEIISSLTALYQISPNIFYPDTSCPSITLSKGDENFLKLLHSLPIQAQKEVREFIVFKKRLWR